MKDLLKNGAIILLVVGVLYLLYLQECKRTDTYPPEDYTLIAQRVWDSVNALADKPPVIKVDTFWRESEPIVIRPPLPEPKPDLADTTINEYSDSLVNEEIAVWIDFRLRGELLWHQWKYVPKTMEIVQHKTVYVPKIIDNPVPTPQNGLYVYFTGGSDLDWVIYGAGLDIVTKKENQYGYMYQRLQQRNFHSLKIGTRIRFRHR